MITRTTKYEQQQHGTWQIQMERQFQKTWLQQLEKQHDYKLLTSVQYKKQQATSNGQIENEPLTLSQYLRNIFGDDETCIYKDTDDMIDSIDCLVEWHARLCDAMHYLNQQSAFNLLLAVGFIFTFIVFALFSGYR